MSGKCKFLEKVSFLPIVSFAVVGHKDLAIIK